MILFQILFTLFALFVLVKTVARYQAKELSARMLVFWILFWLLAETVVLSPHSADVVAYALGIGRGADLIIYVSLAALFFLFFRLLAQLEKQKREITKLTRKISLMEKDSDIKYCPDVKSEF